MSVKRTFHCNLCRDQHEPNNLVGLHWSSWPKGWEEKSPLETENHICMTCISTVQALPSRCGQGYQCEGGPKCGSDHK